MRAYPTLEGPWSLLPVASFPIFASGALLVVVVAAITWAVAAVAAALLAVCSTPVSAPPSFKKAHPIVKRIDKQLNMSWSTLVARKIDSGFAKFVATLLWRLYLILRLHLFPVSKSFGFFRHSLARSSGSICHNLGCSRGCDGVITDCLSRRLANASLHLVQVNCEVNGQSGARKPA